MKHNVMYVLASVLIFEMIWLVHLASLAVALDGTTAFVLGAVGIVLITLLVIIGTFPAERPEPVRHAPYWYQAQKQRSNRIYAARQLRSTTKKTKKPSSWYTAGHDITYTRTLPDLSWMCAPSRRTDPLSTAASYYEGETDTEEEQHY